MYSRENFVLYVLLALVPAAFMNQYLLKKVQPKKSLARFGLFIMLLLAFAFVYTTLVAFILLRFVWSRN